MCTVTKPNTQKPQYKPIRRANPSLYFGCTRICCWLCIWSATPAAARTQLRPTSGLIYPIPKSKGLRTFNTPFVEQNDEMCHLGLPAKGNPSSGGLLQHSSTQGDIRTQLLHLGVLFLQFFETFCSTRMPPYSLR